MTSPMAVLGFQPMALATGIGAEVQGPLATVVIGRSVETAVPTRQARSTSCNSSCCAVKPSRRSRHGSMQERSLHTLRRS